MVLCLPTLVNLWEELLHNRYLPAAISSLAFFATTTRICNGILTLFWLRGRISIGNRIYRLKGNNTIIYEIDLDFSKWLASNYVKEISLYKCDLIGGYLCFISCTVTVFAWKILFLAASSSSPSNIQTFIYNLEVSIRIVDTNQVTFRPKLFD